MFKIESYIGPLLMGYLNKYVKLNEESFKLSLWGGDAVFHNVELQYDILEHVMLLPIGFKSGQVHELKIHIPWTKLGSESVVITLNTVECILELKSDFIKKKNIESPVEIQNSPKKSKYEKNIPSGYLKSYLFNIISNIHVKVNNLIIKFVEDDIVLSMNAKTLEYFPVTENWLKGFVNLSAQPIHIHKMIEIFDLTICLDQMDSNGQIEIYQEPILYRCSVECRLLSNYQNMNSNLPNYIKFNIKFGEIDFNISTCQIPQIRRLIELIYALYYGIIDWDSIVGCGFTKREVVINQNLNSESEINIKPSFIEIDDDERKSQKSWSSWAWSYVPSIFGEEDEFMEEESSNAGNPGFKKTMIFGIFFQSINFKIKKSHIKKSIFGSRRSNCDKTLSHFFSIVGNDIGINIVSNGLGFFNVQMGCTEIKLMDAGNTCVCGQEIPKNQEFFENSNHSEFINIGERSTTEDCYLTDFYLTGSLFSDKSMEIDSVDDDLMRISNLNSIEAYSSSYSQEKCLTNCSALWLDYIYFMQIVKNNLEESELDLQNLCNTDGIRESSQCNLYIGKSVVTINSFFVHNMKEILKSMDTTKYLSYFRSSENVDNAPNTFCTLEEQVARIHEYLPVRRQNISLVNLSIKIHTFTESHQIIQDFPFLEIRTKFLKFSKLVPMYPKLLIGCVTLLNTNLIKESPDLFKKCYTIKSIEITGMSASFLFPVVTYEKMTTDWNLNTFLDPIDLHLEFKSLLYPESWKTPLVLKQNILNVSKINLTLIPSQLKAIAVLIATNFPWINYYLGSRSTETRLSSMYKRLDNLTLQLLGSQSSLIEACHKRFYKNKTYELHISLPNCTVHSRKTFVSTFIDIKIFHNKLELFLKDPESYFTIPVLDNKSDIESNNPQPHLYLLSCQIPNQINSINSIFSMKCQVGSINFMVSRQFFGWFIFPLLELDLSSYIESDIFPMYSSLSKKDCSTSRSSLPINDIRSKADGSSRPESPNIFYNKKAIHRISKIGNINIDQSKIENKGKMTSFSNKGGWWNVIRQSCSKYFFLLQTLDICFKISRSKIYISTVTDIFSFRSQLTGCNQWVENYLKDSQHDGSIFVMKITRLALFNSQKREYLNENLVFGYSESLHYPPKLLTIIDSLPWEIVFHDIHIDCLHSSVQSKLTNDPILLPVSINCTLSATPKCSSPDKLETLYSVSWGVHVDITEVQPTIKQIYLTKLVKLFGDIVLGLPWIDFVKNLQYLITGHYRIVKEHLSDKYYSEDKLVFKSKLSASTNSTKKSKSSIENIEDLTNLTGKSQIVNSKLETLPSKVIETEFTMSFWIQCTLSQFQLVIVNDINNVDDNDSHAYLMLQIDDATSCIDIQEKFVEIKCKLGSVLCQIGLMKQEKIISEIPILKTGSKFIKNADLPFLSKLSQESKDFVDEISNENIIRHCFSISVIRTTLNNLSKRPMSSYHHFSDNESFQSYPTEFTGNFSTAIDLKAKYPSFVTQISCIIDPFDLYLPYFFLNQCIELSNAFETLGNQLMETSFYKLPFSGTNPSPVNPFAIKNEPYFISEDMPQFHLLIKSSRIILPSYQNSKSNKYDTCAKENGRIVIIWKKISLQPFSKNPISRPPIFDNPDEDNYLKIDETQSKYLNCLDDNRQFQLDIFECGLYINQSMDVVTSFRSTKVNFDGFPRKSILNTEVVSTSVIHGQNPAFEWNNFTKLSSLMQKNTENEFLPLMKPINIQIIFAAAIHDSSNKTLQKQIVGGYGLELNILTNLDVFFDVYALDILTSIVTNVNGIFYTNNFYNSSGESWRENKCNVKNVSDVSSLEDFCRLKKIDNMLPSVPFNILMTSRKVQILFILQKGRESTPLSTVYGISISISQPHALLTFKNKENQKFEIALYDVNFSVTPSQWSKKINFYDRYQENFWLNHESLILAEMKTIMNTKPGLPDLKTGVPASLLTMKFSNFYKCSSSQCMVNITRQVLINIDIEDITQISEFLTVLSNKLKSVNIHPEVCNIQKSSSLMFPWTILIPNNIGLCCEMFSINIFDIPNSENKYELKIGPINLSSNLVSNYNWNNIYWTVFFRCDSLVMIHTIFKANKQTNPSKFILYPVKLTCKITSCFYRFNSFEDYWKKSQSSTEINVGIITLCVEDNQVISLHKLFNKMYEILILNQTESASLNKLIINNMKSDNRIEIYYDELRAETFQLITNLSSKENDVASLCGSNMIADEATVCFSGDNEDVASMFWSYPEPRCIVSLEVKPVPFVFIESNLNESDNYEQLQIPCKLEYWNEFNNQYEVFRTFYLSENQTEKIHNLPTVEQLTQTSEKFVAAKSWRVVFDCYARYVPKDPEIKEDSDKAVLIYLSPLTLGASMIVDSCYSPFLIENSIIKLSISQIDFSFYENEKVDDSIQSTPYQSINKAYEDYSISDNNILFKFSIKDISLKKVHLIKEIVISQIELFVSDPFLSLQFPIVVLDDLKLACNILKNVEENLFIDIRTCQVGFDIISLKQMILIMENLKSMITDLLQYTLESNQMINKPKFMICNNLNRRISIRQKDGNFAKISSNNRIEGMGFGESVVLKFLPLKQHKVENKKEIGQSFNEKIEVVLGLWSELKGVSKWTEPIELPIPNFSNMSATSSNFGVWKLDTNYRSDPTVLTNCSTLNSSLNAKNLFFLHHYTSEGLNKIIIFGNTIINNETSHAVNINFSLPTEISSGVSFCIDPETNVLPTSHYINWNRISSDLKNIFELSFRIATTNDTLNSEYRSITYQIDIPKIVDKLCSSQQQQILIKLRLYKSDASIISSQNLHYQFLCTLEWFKFFEYDEMLLLITISSLVIIENQMLRDVNLVINNSKVNENKSLPTIEDAMVVKKRGGILKPLNLFPFDTVQLNASFIGDKLMIFDKSLVLSEIDVLASLGKKLKSIYDNKFDRMDEKEKNLYIADLLLKIIDNNEMIFKNVYLHNPYSIIISISPWLLITNKTQLNLVLSFDRNVYFLEPDSDFVPPQSNDPVRLGYTFQNDIFWSKQFLVGRIVVDQGDNSSKNIMWNVNKNEAIIQLNIAVGKKHCVIPLTLKHLFSDNLSNNVEMQANKFNHLIIESSIYVLNDTNDTLFVETLWSRKNWKQSIDTTVPILDQDERLSLSPKSRYQPIDQFFSTDLNDEIKSPESLLLKINSITTNLRSTIFNYVPIMDFNIFSEKNESETDIKTNFLYLKDTEEGLPFVGYKALTINTVVNFENRKVFIDIFECKFVPMKITNWSSEILLISELINDDSLKSPSIIVIEPNQCVPYWPITFQSDINKDGFGNFTKCYNRFRFGVEVDSEIHWTEFTPVTYSELPSTIELSTIDGKRNLNIIFDYDCCAYVHLNIYQKFQAKRNTIASSLSYQMKKLTISSLSISLLERQDLETFVESIRVSLGNLTSLLCTYTIEKKNVYEILVDSIQIDNKLFSMGLYDFPVFLNSMKTNTNSQFLSIRIETDNCLNYSLNVCFHDEIEIYVENSFLYDLLRIFSQFSHCFQSPKTKTPKELSFSFPPLNIRNVRVSAILLRMTVHAFLKIYVSCEATSLGLPEFVIDGCCLRLNAFQKRLWHHYVTAVLVRFGYVLGSMELLGNPNGIMRHLAQGFTDLLSGRNIDHGLLVDFLLRLLSFCRDISGGFISSFTGIASSVSRNLDYFTLDDTHISRQDWLRRKHQSQGVIQGFIKGLSGFAFSLLGAVAGLADQPLQASQEALSKNSSVSIAVIKGLGKGLIGAVTKPLGGTAELLAQTGRGLLNSTGIAINKCHSDLIQFTLTSRSDILIDPIQFLLYSMPDSFTQENTPILFWSSDAINSDNVPVYLFLSRLYLIEWHIEFPMKNKKNVYLLSNYKISVSLHSNHKYCLKLQFSNIVHDLNFNSESRISAFISELQVDKDVGVFQSNSRTSSSDSTEFVKFPFPSGMESVTKDPVEENSLLLVSPEEINFYSNKSLGGFVDALIFLNYQKNQHWNSDFIL